MESATHDYHFGVRDMVMRIFIVNFTSIHTSSMVRTLLPTNLFWLDGFHRPLLKEYMISQSTRSMWRNYARRLKALLENMDGIRWLCRSCVKLIASWRNPIAWMVELAVRLQSYSALHSRTNNDYSRHEPENAQRLDPLRWHSASSRYFDWSRVRCNEHLRGPLLPYAL